MTLIDLRSDTVTLPSSEMREAMYRAELGDDVYGEDPTVNRLQEKAAARLGKEAALLLPSGTMANLVAVLAHCARGDEAIMGDTSHLFLDEAGNISAVGGVVIHTLPNERGMLAPERVAAAVRPDHIRHPRSRLVCLENAHNHDGGVVLTAAQTRADLDDFVRCYHADNRHDRQESERFCAFGYDELLARDKVSLDIFWLKDESLEDTENLPAPDVLAAEIVENLRAALEQFEGIVEELSEG